MGLDLEFHKYADLFPLLEGEEYEQLVENIQEKGLMYPIVTYEGKILDGRNRYRACYDAGVAPAIEKYEGDDPIGHVIALNIVRRHLTKSQLAGLSLRVLPHLEAEAKKRMLAGKKDPTAKMREGESSEHAGKMLGVSRRYVQEAKAIQANAPELIEEVVQGRLPLPQAKVLSEIENVGVRKEVLGAIKKAKSSVSETKELVRQKTRRTAPATKPEEDKNTGEAITQIISAIQIIRAQYRLVASKKLLKIHVKNLKQTVEEMEKFLNFGK